jgi:hypothetical protein
VVLARKRDIGYVTPNEDVYDLDDWIEPMEHQFAEFVFAPTAGWDIVILRGN